LRLINQKRGGLKLRKFSPDEATEAPGVGFGGGGRETQFQLNPCEIS